MPSVVRDGRMSAASTLARTSGATTAAGCSTPMPASRSRLCRTIEAENAVAVMSRAAGELGLGEPEETEATFEGNALLQRVADPMDSAGRLPDADGQRPPSPLASAKAGYESPSRFTAVARNRSGQPVVFVFALRGLRWKLVNIELPPE